MTSVLGSSSPVSAREPAPMTLVFPRSDADLDDDASREVAFIESSGCVASSVSALEREVLEAAYERVRLAFSDPAVRALVMLKTRWIDARGDSVRDSTTIGPRLARAFAGASSPETTRATLIAYDCDRACPVIGGEIMNAFTRAGSRVVALHRPFLERAAHAADPEAGGRVLARALAHELAHVLGFEHPAALAAVTTEGYANSVPVFVGCVALHYPDLEAIRGACGRPEAEPPWTVACDGRARVADLGAGLPVVVRVASDWVDARVVAIDKDLDELPRRVEVDFGLRGVAPKIVDACRVRSRRP